MLCRELLRAGVVGRHLTHISKPFWLRWSRGSGRPSLLHATLGVGTPAAVQRNSAVSPTCSSMRDGASVAVGAAVG